MKNISQQPGNLRLWNFTLGANRGGGSICGIAIIYKVTRKICQKLSVSGMVKGKSLIWTFLLSTVRCNKISLSLAFFRSWKLSAQVPTGTPVARHELSRKSINLSSYLLSQSYRQNLTLYKENKEMIDPSFVKEMLSLRVTNHPARERYKLNLEILKSIHVRCGTKSSGYFSQKVWNSMPYQTKSSENLSNCNKTQRQSKDKANCMCKIYQIWSCIIWSLHVRISHLILHMSN